MRTTVVGLLALTLAACGGEATPAPEGGKVVQPAPAPDNPLPEPSAYEPEDEAAQPFALLEIFTSEG